MKPILALCVVSISKIPKYSIKPCLFPLIKKNSILSSVYYRHTASTSTAKSEESVNWGHNKSHRKIKLNFTSIMDSKSEEILAPFRQLVKEQVNGGIIYD